MIKAPTKTQKLEYLDATLLMQHVLSCCPHYADRFVETLKRHPSSHANQWHCIMGFDEFNSGDKLKVFMQGKKMMCLYFTFEELEENSSNSMWLPLAAVRSHVLNLFEGGWSNVFTQMLHRTFYGRLGLSVVGVAFSHRGRHCIFYAKLSNILSDGDGLKLVTGWRGASGLRPCLVHSNILMKGSDLDNRQPGFVEISCTDPSLIRETTSSEFRFRCDLIAEAHSRFKAGRMTKGMYENICKSEGQNYVPGGLGFDSRIRSVGLDWFPTITVDWVHTLLQDGVFTTEARCMIGAMAIPGEKLKEYLQQNWEFPKAFETKGRVLWRVSDSYRLDDDGNVDKLRCSLSECLGLFSFLRYFFYRKARDRADLKANCDSFNACCDLLAFILAVKR